MNRTVEGILLSLTYCMLCNAPTLSNRRDTNTFVDGEGERWTITCDALERESDRRELTRVSRCHGLFFAFRS
ncbi:hypothetical protein [Natrinema sp. DC36]|uniref:hypothetical protein n=1 Tax=Natrinema sp. DC36 TaxID=2878680 RepID=UPI001CF0958B|nr:hypothetical protein [Natrinema sp. DC36]